MPVLAPVLPLHTQNIQMALYAVWVQPLLLKWTVHPQIILLKIKYVMLITVNKNLTIIITNYTWYHKYKEIIKIIGGGPLWLCWMPDSKGKRESQMF